MKKPLLVVEIGEKDMRPVHDYPGGVVGRISWHRLAREALPASGDVKPNEIVTHFVVSEEGLTIRYSRVWSTMASLQVTPPYGNRFAFAEAWGDTTPKKKRARKLRGKGR